MASLKALLGAAGGTSLRARLITGAFGSFVLAVCSKGLTLLASILMARLMGAAGFGVYTTAFALIMLLSVPTTLGLPTLLVRLLASYQVREEWELMRGLLTRANKVVLVLAVLIAVLAATVIWLLSDQLGSTLTMTLWCALGLLPLMTLNSLRSAALRGLRHVVLGQVPELAIMPGLFVVLLLVWWGLGHGTLPPVFAIGARLAATAVAFAVGSTLLVKRIPGSVRQAISRYDMRYWVRSAAPLLVLGGLSIVNTQTDVLMLAILRGPESAGIYRAAARGAELAAFALTVIIMVLQPAIARLYAMRDMARLQHTIAICARAGLVAALPVALILILLAHLIMKTVFGPEFTAGAVVLGILAGAQVVNAGMGPVGQILMMTGHELQAAQGMALGAAVNVILNLLFIPVWGAMGAAIATGLSLAVWNVSLAVQVYRLLGLHTTVLGALWRR